MFYIFLVFIITVIVFKFFFSKKAVVKRKLKNAVVKKISNFKDGEIAKIIGNIEIFEKPLIAPLSNRKCSYYHIHIEQKVSSGKNSHWKTLIEEEVSSKFLIREGDKYGFINDKNFKCYIVQDKKYSSGLGNDATENLEKYLKSKGYESEGFFGFNKRLRYKEGILEDNEKVAVFGKGEWKEVDNLKLPKKYGKVLEIRSNEGVAVYLSDDPDTTIDKAKKENLEMKSYSFEKGYRK